MRIKHLIGCLICLTTGLGSLKASWNGIVSGSSPDQVAIFSTGTNTFNTFIPLSASSLASVISPDGTRIYTADSSPDGVTVIDATTNTIITTIPTSTGPGAFDIIINPTGTKVYVSNDASGYVTVIDTATNSVDTDIYIGGYLGPLSITPDGSTLYVSNFSFGGVIAIDTATNTVGTAIATGISPGLLSITPDGLKGFVGNIYSDTVSVIDLITQTVTNTISLPSGAGPYGSSILPNGLELYIVNINNNTVTVIDIASELITTTITLSDAPFWAATTPDSKTVYVINETNDLVFPIDVATKTVGTTFGGAGGNLQDIVISADQAPVAYFTAVSAPVGSPVSFDASSSYSPVGTVVTYDWDFGDGSLASTPSPFINHTYTTAGSFNVTLIVTNSAGTSNFPIYSSRFMSNNGGPSAKIILSVEVLPTPASHLVGFQTKHQSPFRINIINVLEWDAPLLGSEPVSYKIFRDSALTDLLATVPGTAPLHYYDQNRASGVNYTYYLVSVSSDGTYSAPVSVTVTSVY